MTWKALYRGVKSFSKLIHKHYDTPHSTPYVLHCTTTCSRLHDYSPDVSHIARSFSYIYRVSQEEWTKLRESVPYVKIYRYNPKHLYPKLNGYGDNCHRKVWASGGSTFCTPSVTPYSSTAHARQRDIIMQWPWRMLYSTVALTSQDNVQLRPA